MPAGLAASPVRNNGGRPVYAGGVTHASMRATACAARFAAAQDLAQALDALRARGHEPDDEQQGDQEAQRVGVANREARRRNAGAKVVQRGEHALAVRDPQRLGRRVGRLDRQPVGERRRRTVRGASRLLDAGEGRRALRQNERRDRHRK